MHCTRVALSLVLRYCAREPLPPTPSAFHDRFLQLQFVLYSPRPTFLFNLQRLGSITSTREEMDHDHPKINTSFFTESVPTVASLPFFFKTKEMCSHPPTLRSDSQLLGDEGGGPRSNFYDKLMSLERCPSPPNHLFNTSDFNFYDKRTFPSGHQHGIDKECRSLDVGKNPRTTFYLSFCDAQHRPEIQYVSHIAQYGETRSLQRVCSSPRKYSDEDTTNRSETAVPVRSGGDKPQITDEITQIECVGTFHKRRRLWTNIKHAHSSSNSLKRQHHSRLLLCPHERVALHQMPRSTKSSPTWKASTVGTGDCGKSSAHI